MVFAGLLVRAQMATAIGIPLAACTLVTDVVLLLWRCVGGIPPLHRELLGHGVLALLSAAVLGVALLAWHRTRRPTGWSRSPRLTRGIPLLVILGVAGGLLVGNLWGHEALELDRSVLTGLCEQLLPAGPHGDPAPAALAACLEVAIGCREAGVAADGAFSAQLPDSLWPSRDSLACIKRQLPPSS